MRFSIFASFFLLSFLLMGCGGSASSGEQASEENPQQAEQAAWDEMMETHDAVMPKMAALNRTGRELKAVAETTEDKAVKENINQTVKSLEAASESMMVWMGELQKLSELREDKSHEEIMAYLKEEKANISQVKEDMEKSLKNGQELLDELQTETE
jgi:chemotaxis protein histidine kinase CheA